MATTSFEFITLKAFREALVRDYSEMQTCAQAQAWKSVHVLAGSIIESLLVDHVLSAALTAKSKKDPLRMDLAELVALCVTEKVVTERTADLCSVIRSYRNLIHPGRTIRLAEPQPSMKSAQIALALVDLIVEDIAKSRQSKLGLTAEQVVSKVTRDKSSLAILQHLLKDVTAEEVERLVVELLPQAHAAALNQSDDPFGDDERAKRLENAYRKTLESAPREVRERAASEFVRVLREEDGETVSRYTRTFFRPEDLAFVHPTQVAMIRQHLLSCVPPSHDADSLRFVDGIAPHLVPDDVPAWLDPFVRTGLSAKADQRTKAVVRAHLFEAMGRTTADVDKSVDARLETWIGHLQRSSAADKAAIVSDLKSEIEAMRIPF